MCVCLLSSTTAVDELCPFPPAHPPSLLRCSHVCPSTSTAVLLTDPQPLVPLKHRYDFGQPSASNSGSTLQVWTDVVHFFLFFFSFLKVLNRTQQSRRVHSCIGNEIRACNWSFHCTVSWGSLKDLYSPISLPPSLSPSLPPSLPGP